MASIAWRQGMRALVTRPREEAEALASAVAARGVGALIEPMMQVHFRHAILDFTGVQAVLCTSANGVRALARASAERAMPLLAVGDATAARARAEGFTTVASAGGAAADLARLAAERLRPQDGLLLHVCGSVLASDLAGALGAHGFAVERSVLYSAQPVAALSLAAVRALSAGEIDFALFFSPRTAAVFVRLAEAAGVAQGCRTATALSISAAADKALDPVPWAERRIAERPNQAALLDKLDGLLAERRRG
jgi:uroporphyrinogen-III synthase